MGANGTGKTSMLREIWKNQNPAIQFAESAVPAFFSQLHAEILNENNSIFVITPPVAALLTSKVLKKECVAFSNEGMEAMFELKVENIPGIVAIHKGTWHATADAYSAEFNAAFTVENGNPDYLTANTISKKADSYYYFFREIGVSNVHKRLQYEFGEAYGITIDSVEGEYTEFVFTLPTGSKKLGKK